MGEKGGPYMNCWGNILWIDIIIIISKTWVSANCTVQEAEEKEKILF